MGNLSVKLIYYCISFDLETYTFIQQSVIESGMMAVTIPYLPIYNFWLNSVQKHTLSSQVRDKIDVKICSES